MRFTLLQTTDTVLALIDQHIVGLWREARQRAESQAVYDLGAYRTLVDQLWGVAADTNLAEEPLREQVVELLEPFRASRLVSRTAAIRMQMTAHKTKLRTLLSAIIDLPFKTPPDHPLTAALAIMRELYGSGSVELPAKYETVSKRAKLTDEKLAWREVLCDVNMTADLVRSIQTRLSRSGHYGGRIDGLFGPKTIRAVNTYAKAKKLPVGTSYIAVETAKAMGLES